MPGGEGDQSDRRQRGLEVWSFQFKLWFCKLLTR